MDDRRAAQPGDPRPMLRISGLTKTFPGVRALSNLSLEVHPGEIVAVIGQNGSGKSTLVKLLAGVHSADSGTVEVLDESGDLLVGPDALEHLHFIHQDLGLIPGLSSVENLGLGRRAGLGAFSPVRKRRERREAETLVARFGEVFDVTAAVSTLTAAEQRILAIARALSGWLTHDNLLVLDEPTVALPSGEVRRLFDAVRRVAAEGAGVIFISHRLDEVLDLADRIVVLRGGQLVADIETTAVDHDELVRLITGRQLADAPAPRAHSRGEPVLSARGLAGGSVIDLSFDLLPGEIVGVGGLIGSGREHVAALLFGALKRAGGEVVVRGEPLRSGDPRTAIRRGLAFVPAERREHGAIMDLYARENLTLPRLAPLRRRFGRLDRGAERRDVAEWARRVDLQPLDAERPLKLFSGGNQQKVVLAKWLRTDPLVLLLDEPTQGVDVGAQASVYALIAAAAESGAAVVVASSEAKEIEALCHRALVMRDGRVAATLARHELTEENLVSASLGLRQQDLDSLFGQHGDSGAAVSQKR